MFKTKFNPKATPQGQPIPGREKEQVKNRAGGFVFTVDPLEHLRRFVTIGTAGGTFYAKEQDLTQEAYGLLAELDRQGKAKEAVDLIVDVSDRGLALKNDYALYALAVLASRHAREAFAALPKVARIGTHYFHFVEYYKQLGGGWGKQMKRAIQKRFLETPIDQLEYDMVKYQSRDGWAQRDLLRKSHPKAGESGQRTELLHWAVKGNLRTPDGLELVAAFEEAKTADKARVVALIERKGLTREMIPTQYLNDPDVQMALLPKMPLHALIRNLGNMTKSGLLTAAGSATLLVESKLQKEGALRKSRVHPFAILVALNTYKNGQGLRGGGHWRPIPRVVDALDAAFYDAAETAAPSGKSFVIGIDGSGSMSHMVPDLNMPVRHAAVAMALITLKSEKACRVVGFTNRPFDVPLSGRQRLDDALAMFNKYVEPEATDVSVPMQHAVNQGWFDVDAFAVYTDNETWKGVKHPTQMLAEYRQQSGRNTKLVACAMTVTNYTVADPADPRQMNVVGFSADAAKVISDFTREA